MARVASAIKSLICIFFHTSFFSHRFLQNVHCKYHKKAKNKKQNKLIIVLPLRCSPTVAAPL